MGSCLQHSQTLTMRSALLCFSSSLLPLLLLLPTTSEATIAIAVASGTTTLLSLTAAQVTGLAALKLLGVTAGAVLARRGKREEPSNQIDDSSILAMTSTLEPEQCYQLSFCTLATNNLNIDSDVKNIYKVVTSMPSKYRTARKFGLSGAKCSLRYKCSVKAEDIIQFYQSY